MSVFSVYMSARACVRACMCILHTCMFAKHDIIPINARGLERWPAEELGWNCNFENIRFEMFTEIRA